MFTARPRTATGTRRRSALLAILLIWQTLALPLTTSLTAAPLTSQSVTEPASPAAPTDPLAAEPAPVPAADAGATPHQEALDVYLTMTIDRALLLVGETATLTLTVVSSALQDEKDLQLRLDLPKGIATTAGAKGKLRWTMPTLAAGQVFQQQVQVIVDKPKQALKQAVLTFVMQVDAAGRAPQMVTQLLGIAPTLPAPITEQGTEGAVLQNSAGDVVLLVEPGAVAEGVRFRYTELYHWQPVTKTVASQAVDSQAVVSQVVDSQAVVSQMVTSTLSTLLYLPLALSLTEPVNAGAFAPQPAPQTLTAAGEEAPSDTPLPISDHNIDAYQIWHLDAQQANTEVAAFDPEVYLVVSAQALIAAGVDPTGLALWTRASASERWGLVASEYDAATQSFAAWLPHFSDFSLGQGMENNADLLPSVRGFTTDRVTGGATIQYPIETPPGLGGMAPNLSFAYSSVGVDDLYRIGGDTGYRTQTSGVGIGWAIGGLSRIVRAGGSLDNQTLYKDREYVLALNGAYVRIRYENDGWHTDPEIFAKIERAVAPGGNGKDYVPWTIITADGTRYTFGDTTVTDSAFVANATTATFVERQDGGAYERLAKEWYLRTVEDTSGNRMTYDYAAEQGQEPDCGSSLAQQWYVRAIYPVQIVWSSHPSSDPTLNVPAKLRVQFGYENADRLDWNIDGAVEDNSETECKQVKFARRDKLNTVSVQVDAGGWQTVRSYALGQSYSTSNRRILLNTLEQRGKDGSVGQRYTFTYEGTTLNAIRLKSADNGWGGKVTYTYTAHPPSASSAICNGHCKRQAVTRTVAEDGQQNTTQIDYYYGPTSMPSGATGRWQWSAIDNTGEFMGFIKSEATYYAVKNSATPTPPVIKWDMQETWQGGRDNPDPQRGKLKHQETRTTSGTGTLLAAADYNWQAYRRAYSGCTAEAGWCTTPTTASSHYEGSERIYHTLWLRLESTSAWTAGAGQLTQQFYQAARQNNLQFGNLTEVQTWSHAEYALDYPTWAGRVANHQLALLRTTTTEYFPNATLNLGQQPARVRLYAPSGTCQAETRYIYDDLNGNYNGLPSRGLRAKTQQALTACSDTAVISMTDPNWTETRWAYDAYGNPTVVHHVGTSTANNDQTITVYDSVYKLFPIEQYSYQNSALKETALYYGVNGLALSDPKAAWGAMQEQCAVNEICTRQAYDAFGRPTRRWAAVAKGSAWGNDTDASVQVSYIPAGSNNQTVTTITEWHNPRSEGNFTRKLYNGLGQLVQTQTPNQNWSQEIMVDYTYDALGNLVKTSVPRAISGYPGWPNNLYRGASFAQGVTTTAYDALGRPTQSTAPNGEVTVYSYAGRASLIAVSDRLKSASQADAHRSVRWQELDGLGYLRTTRTWTYTGNYSWSEQARVTLTHDVAGNLTAVTHPNGLGTTTLSYDLAGRKTAMNDIDLGVWSYAYDRQGKLTRQTDAKNQTTCLYYENGLERLVGKHLRSDTNCPASNASYAVQYQYDQGHSSANRSRGQLTHVDRFGAYGKHITYDALGRLTHEEVWINGASTNDHTAYGYDAYNRQNVTQYPDGSAVQLAYNSLGLPNALCDAQWTGNTWACAPGAPLVDSVSYDEAGRLRTARYPAGGNLWRTQGYHNWSNAGASPSSWTPAAGDGNGRLQYLFVGTQPGWGDRYGSEYQYDSFGNISRFKQWVNNVNVSDSAFAYDAQNRLTQGYGLAYNYDGSGRLTHYEGVGYTAYDAHAVTDLNGGPWYGYDANGYMQYRWVGGGSSWQTLTWDAENHLTSVVGNGVNESYLYDADGIRVRKVADVLTTFYPNAFYEVRTLDGVASAQVDAAVPPPPPTAEVTHTVYLPLIAQPDGLVHSSDLGRTTITKYYYFNGQRIAMRQDGVLTYLHGDHLGSTVLATDSSGQTVSAQGYYAYGRDRGSNSLPTDHQFTGQKKDDTGLMYYGARYYDPQIGTFISPDTLVPDPTHVFDYNRYMYARGNPLKYNDPTGHCATLDDGAPDRAQDAACWTAADEVYQSWPADPHWWSGGAAITADDWLQHTATQDYATEQYHRDRLQQFWAPKYRAWGVQHAAYNPAPTLNPVTNPSISPCEDSLGFCVTVALDGISTVAAGVALRCSLVGAVPCAGAASAVSTVAGGLGTVWTATQTLEGNGTEVDLITTTATFTIGAANKGNPYVGFAASLYQWYYDTHPQAILTGKHE